MNLPRRHAFTLAEMMVVVAILGLLVAIIMPYLTDAFASQRRVECALHLEKIGQACAARKASQNMGGLSAAGQVAANGWQYTLKTFVSQDLSVFVCPEDGNPAPDPGGGLKGVCIECYHGGNFVWDVYLDQADSDQWIWKMSGTQYREFMKVSGEGKTTGFKGVYTSTGYVPDEDPYTTYYTFEDTAPWGGGDQDFYDVVLEVRQTAAQVQFAVMVRASGMSFTLCKKDPDRQVIIADPRVGKTAAIEFYGGKSSYGMNSVSARLMSAKRKLLVMDYEQSVAVGSTYDEGTGRAQHLGFWDPPSDEPKASPTFARHFGKCNVLLVDGSVKLMSPDEINPNDPDNTEKYWDP